MRLVYIDCKFCKGTGEFLGRECKNCRGEGQIAVKVDDDMTLFNGYNMIKDEKLRKKIMGIDAIAYRRNKAVENRIRVAKAAIENNDIKTFCDVMHVDTKLFSEELENLPEDERKRALEDARQSAKEQQERLSVVQHQQWEKERNIKYGYIQDK